ncbi:MAG: hypothetical protein V4604_14475 [Bacteroidota bacterium]
MKTTALIILLTVSGFVNAQSLEYEESEPESDSIVEAEYQKLGSHCDKVDFLVNGYNQHRFSNYIFILFVDDICKHTSTNSSLSHGYAGTTYSRPEHFFNDVKEWKKVLDCPQ